MKRRPGTVAAVDGHDRRDVLEVVMAAVRIGIERGNILFGLYAVTALVSMETAERDDGAYAGGHGTTKYSALNRYLAPDPRG